MMIKVVSDDGIDIIKNPALTRVNPMKRFHPKSRNLDQSFPHISVNTIDGIASINQATNI